MASTAICYVTDLGFLFPSIVSIRSLLARTPIRDAQIYLFLVDVDAETTAGVAAATKADGVHIIAMQGNDLSAGINLDDFNKTHVPLTTLARFFIEPHLLETIQQVLYIDGDTLVNAPDVAALIETPVPAGRFLAAEDISSFCRNDISDYGRVVRAYFRGLGVTAHDGYFNAGVFKASRQTWKQIGADAFSFFLNNTKVCRYHDQSALNAVVKDRRLIMSTKYNFQTPYMRWGLEKRISPALYHFTQFVKPWMGDCPPWGKFYPYYHALENERVKLALPLKFLSQEDAVRESKNERNIKLGLYGPMLPRLLSRRRKFLANESRAFLR